MRAWFKIVLAAAVLTGSMQRLAEAGFGSPESVVRNVYGHYGQGLQEVSNGLRRDEDTAKQFFDLGLQQAWLAAKTPPYDFFVQSPKWKISDLVFTIVRRQFDRTYVAADFNNNGRHVSLNFILVNGSDGWVIYDVESPYDSLRLFLQQLQN
jgi:hypothetical protein